MTAPILDRVRKACSKNHGMTAEALSVLREEVAKEAEKADIAAANAQQEAVQPFLSESEIAAGKTKADDLAFIARRLAAAVEYLDKEIEAQKDREEEDWKRELQSEAQRLINVAVTGIHKKYPGIQKGLLELQQDIGRARVAVRLANKNRPEGCEKLQMPEAIAFGYAGREIRYEPAQIAEMLVPDLDNWACPAWPPRWGPLSNNRITGDYLTALFEVRKKK